MGKPDYLVRVTGAMPDGTVVDRKFECVEDAFKLSREMVVVNVEYLKSIVLRQSIGKSHAVEPLTKEQQKERDRQYSLERWRSIMCNCEITADGHRLVTHGSHTGHMVATVALCETAEIATALAEALARARSTGT